MSGNGVREILRARLETIHERISAACQRVGRCGTDCTLVAVTKNAPMEAVAELHSLGVDHMGENRPQELWRKASLLPRTIHWHLIGHLQRNKIERTLPLVDMIHSVDSLRLLDALDEAAATRPGPLEVLLEVNASREPNKHGFAPEEVAALASRLPQLRRLRVAGLMTMAALGAPPERCRATFAEVRLLCETLRGQLGSLHPLKHLSMGMSNDFELAIEEGATLVRIGSALFEGLPGSAAK